MKKRILSMLLAALLCLALMPAGPLAGAALAAEEPDYTSVEVTEESFEKVYNLAYGLYMENPHPGTGGGFTWDSEGKKRSWTYYNGIMMDAFLMLDSENCESYVNTFYKNNVTSQGRVNSSGAADNYYRENELDSIPPTRALFDLLRSNSVSDAEKNNYKRMIDYVYSVMSRFEVIPGTNDNFRHKMNNANWETYQLPLDGMYMAQPFFMELANALDDGTLTLEDFTSYTGSDEILEDTDKIYFAVFDRMYWVGDNLYDDGNGLYNHAWGPDAGLNGQYWLRAVGWYAAALADVISMLPDNFAEERDMLIEIETRLFDGMIAHQDRDTGMWYNVINYGPELAGPESMNQLESSGSALMAYAMMRSYAEGYVERRYGAAGLRAFNAIAALKLDEGGLYDVYQTSGVETTPEGYLSKPYVTNDARGVGPLFMAAAWAKQAAEKYNQPVAVPLCALDGDTNEALPGVTAQVLDGDGALVAEWNSTTEPQPVEGILPGVEYTIHVISAPAGYALPEDAVFSLNEETLQITLNGTPIDDDVIDIRLFKNHLNIVTAPAFKGHQLVLSGQIGMNFYMTIPEGMTDGTMTFTVGERTATAAGALQSDGRYKFTCYVNSVEMAEQITAVYSYTVDGETKTVSCSSSVKAYLEIIIHNENNLAEYTAATPLAKALYNYGYYAMQAVPGGSKHPAMPDTYIGDTTLITSLEGYAISATLDKDVITKASYSLVLDSETAINFYLTTETELTKDNVSVTAAEGTTFEYTVEKVGSRYRVQITGIGAHELGTAFTMTTGNTTITASAMTYVQQSLANSNAGAATKNAAAALYEYYLQAISYNN